LILSRIGIITLTSKIRVMITLSIVLPIFTPIRDRITTIIAIARIISVIGSICPRKSIMYPRWVDDSLMYPGVKTSVFSGRMGEGWSR
jgi:hypothetical protein